MLKLTYDNFKTEIDFQMFTNKDNAAYDIYSGLLQMKEDFTKEQIDSIPIDENEFYKGLENLEDWFNRTFTSESEPETQLTDVNQETQDLYKDVILEVVKPEKVVIFEPKNTRYAPLIPFIMKYAEFEHTAITKPYKEKLMRDAKKVGFNQSDGSNTISWSTIRSLILETRIFEQAKTKQNEDNILN